MRRNAGRMLRHGWLLAVVAALLVPAVAGAQVAKKKPTSAAAHQKHQKSKDDGDREDVAGAFYTTTNGNPNQLLWFVRHHDGRLTFGGSVATGGNGGHQPQPINVPGLPAPVCEGASGSGCPSLDSQAALRGTPDGKLLFAVNAGSNTVSSFRVTGNGPVLVSQISSGGAFPNSLTVRGNLLYVLNSNSLSVQGMTFNSSGTLTPLGGPHALNPSGTAPGSPKDIEFDNTGHWLLVTKLVNPMAFSPVNTIDTFPVHLDGSVGAPVSSNSAAPVPFSMGFDAGNNVLVSTVGDPFAFKPGTVESYSIGSTGALTHIASASTNGYAPCWNQETNDRSYSYVVNADIAGPSAPSVSTFKLSGNGQLQLVGVTPHAGAEPFQTDEALSRDDKYLYVISPVDDRSFDPISHVDVFKIGEDHKPRLIQQTPFNLPHGLTGAAAY
jgi:6-phosphogluconolactonase